MSKCASIIILKMLNHSKYERAVVRRMIWDVTIREALKQCTGYSDEQVVAAGQVLVTPPAEFISFDCYKFRPCPFLSSNDGYYYQHYEMGYVLHIYGPHAPETALILATRLQWQSTKDILYPKGMALKRCSIVNTLTEWINRNPYTRCDIDLAFVAALKEPRTDAIEHVNLDLKVK